MRSWTYLEMKTRVLNDLDLTEETFITATEMLGYFNEAIDVCEANIHTLYEDYFLTSASIALVSGTATYAFPSDIYANKIRSIYYVNGSTKYEIMRWKYPLSRIPFVDVAENYMYLPINTTASGYQLQLLPTSRDTGSYVTIWYIRNAKVLVNDSDVCDIPEFANFIIQYVKMRCYEKEGHPTTLKAMQDVEMEKKLMIETLTNMTDDENTTIPMDLSFYQDFDNTGFDGR